MVLAALTLIALLTIALVVNVALIARDLSVEPQAKPQGLPQSSSHRVPVAA